MYKLLAGKISLNSIKTVYHSIPIVLFPYLSFALLIKSKSLLSSLQILSGNTALKPMQYRENKIYRLQKEYKFHKYLQQYLI